MNFTRHLETPGTAISHVRSGQHYPQSQETTLRKEFSAKSSTYRDRFEVDQTDWGCWVATIKPAELLELMDGWYGRDPIYPPKWTLKEGQTLDASEIMQFVQRLDQSKNVALVALES